METVHDWLNCQKASEIMTRNVTCLGPSDRVADAVNLFLREQISGAPVVDSQGQCIGVISASDIVSFAENRERPAAKCACFDTWNAGAKWWLSMQHVRNELRPRMEHSVMGYMTRDVVSVTDETPIGNVIRRMIDARVHRVLVLDSARQVVGIITTMDVLAAAQRAGTRSGRELMESHDASSCESLNCIT